VYPSPDIEPLQSVKWHPKQPDSLAVASESKIYLLNIVDADQTFAGAPIAQTDLQHVGAVFAMPSPLVAFDFDVHHFALGTVAADSTLTLWSIRDKQPFWAQKIRGDDVPSSVAFIDGGVILGRRNGTVFQLLPVMSRAVSATVRLAAPDDAAAAGLFGRATTTRASRRSGSRRTRARACSGCGSASSRSPRARTRARTSTCGRSSSRRSSSAA
jgi:hypothetical protein